jgi:hypothetical protein
VAARAPRAPRPSEQPRPAMASAAILVAAPARTGAAMRAQPTIASTAVAARARPAPHRWAERQRAITARAACRVPVEPPAAISAARGNSSATNRRPRASRYLHGGKPVMGGVRSAVPASRGVAVKQPARAATPAIASVAARSVFYTSWRAGWAWPTAAPFPPDASRLPTA